MFCSADRVAPQSRLTLPDVLLSEFIRTSIHKACHSAIVAHGVAVSFPIRNPALLFHQYPSTTKLEPSVCPQMANQPRLPCLPLTNTHKSNDCGDVVWSSMILNLALIGTQNEAQLLKYIYFSDQVALSHLADRLKLPVCPASQFVPSTLKSYIYSGVAQPQPLLAVWSIIQVSTSARDKFLLFINIFYCLETKIDIPTLAVHNMFI